MFQSQAFFALTLDGGEYLASPLGRFTPRGTASITLKWLGPRAGLRAEADRKLPASTGNRTRSPSL